MTEQEKAIRELAQKYDDIKTKSYKFAIGQSNMAYAYFVAKELYDASYRKLKDSEVIIDKNELPCYTCPVPQSVRIIVIAPPYVVQ